jgi:single-strand DNA-binding protein
MQGDVIVTVIGNVTGDPELRYTPSGAAVCNFTVATNPRRFDKNSNTWVDGEPTFRRVNVWRQHGENVAESVRKGDRVVVVGAEVNRKYETQDGGIRFSLEVNADAVALDTKWAVVTARKAERQQGGQQGGQQAQQQGQQPQQGQGYQQQQGQQGYGQGGQQRQDPWDQGPPPGSAQQPPAQDPWGQSPQQQTFQGGGFADEPPF